MAFVSTKPVSVIETLFINNLAKTRTYGYLPPHGKALAAGSSKTFTGDIRAKMNARELASLQRDQDSGACSIFVYHRMLLSLPVPDGTAVAADAPVIWNTLTSAAAPASDTVWNADLATTQADFTNVFLGVAVQSKAASGDAVIQVDISPETVREFTCASETHEVTEMLSMDKAAGNALLATTLEKAVASSSPFRCRRADAAAATKVLCSWHSAFWGNNAAGAQ